MTTPKANTTAGAELDIQQFKAMAVEVSLDNMPDVFVMTHAIEARLRAEVSFSDMDATHIFGYPFESFADIKAAVAKVFVLKGKGQRVSLLVPNGDPEWNRA